MGIRYKFERLFGRFLRGGAKIALFIDIAFGVAGTIFALWTSVRPRVDDYGNAAPSLWEQCGALEVLGGSLLVGLMGFVLAFALHMGVRYLKRLWKSSTLGRVCVAVYFMYPAYCLLMGNVILFVLSSLFEIMLAIWLLAQRISRNSTRSSQPSCRPVLGGLHLMRTPFGRFFSGKS